MRPCFPNNPIRISWLSPLGIGALSFEAARYTFCCDKQVHDRSGRSGRGLRTTTKPLVHFPQLPYTTMIRPLLRRAGLLTLAVLLIQPMALAQPQNDDPANDTSPEEIEKVAEALIQIEEVRKTYQKKMRNATTKEKVQTYQRQMTVKISQAIDNVEGMTFERYEEITNAAQSDYELKKKILTKAKKKKGNAPSKNKGR